MPTTFGQEPAPVRQKASSPTDDYEKVLQYFLIVVFFVIVVIVLIVIASGQMTTPQPSNDVQVVPKPTKVVNLPPGDTFIPPERSGIFTYSSQGTHDVVSSLTPGYVNVIDKIPINERIELGCYLQDPDENLFGWYYIYYSQGVGWVYEQFWNPLTNSDGLSVDHGLIPRCRL